jgi:hypothetical protein
MERVVLALSVGADDSNRRESCSRMIGVSDARRSGLCFRGQWDRLDGREEEPLGQSEAVCVFCDQCFVISLNLCNQGRAIRNETALQGRVLQEAVTVRDSERFCWVFDPVEWKERRDNAVKLSLQWRRLMPKACVVLVAESCPRMLPSLIVVVLRSSTRSRCGSRCWTDKDQLRWYVSR